MTEDPADLCNSRVTFRALAQSDHFDTAWRLLAQTYKKDVVLPKNVVPLPMRGRG